MEPLSAIDGWIKKEFLHLVGYDRPELVLLHHKTVYFFAMLKAEEKKALNNRILQQITIFVMNNHSLILLI